MAMTVKGRTIIPGEAEGPALVLSKPISFWGGVSPQDGTIAHPQHPQFGQSIAHTILVIPQMIGSSSSSAIMLELLRIDCAPQALVLFRPDAILSLGVIVGREMGYKTCPIVEVSDAELLTGQRVKIFADGNLACMTIEE